MMLEEADKLGYAMWDDKDFIIPGQQKSISQKLESICMEYFVWKL